MRLSRNVGASKQGASPSEVTQRPRAGTPRRRRSRLPNWLRLVLIVGGVAAFEAVYVFVTQNTSLGGLILWFRALIDRLLG